MMLTIIHYAGQGQQLEGMLLYLLVALFNSICDLRPNDSPITTGISIPNLTISFTGNVMIKLPVKKNIRHLMCTSLMKKKN